MTTASSDSVGPRPRLEWLPPLMVGAAAATTVEVAVGILLYGGVGMIRSLSTILAVSAIAFACGLWSAPSAGPDLVDRLRRRWLLALFAFLVAAVFGTLWSIYEVIGAGRIGQTIGLALIAALPMFAAGSAAGGMSVAAASDPAGRLRAPGPYLALGAAFGVVATGFLLPRAPIPASLLVGCLVLLSLGGMVFGGVLGARTEIETLATRPAPGDPATVQEVRRDVDSTYVRELREGAFFRRGIPLEGPSARPWDVAALRTLLPDLDAPIDILMIGSGASSAPTAVVREHPRASVHVLERTAAVVELGRDYFSTGLTIGTADRLTVQAGNLDDLIQGLDARYDVVLVDTRALAPIGGHAGISQGGWERLYRGLTPGGVFVWGPDAPEAGNPETRPGWSQIEFRRGARSAVAEHVVFVREGPDAVLPDVLNGFDR